jgi:hypothetical protein
MKPSDKLLAILVSAILITTLANNFLLSAEYKKIDANDRLPDYKTTSSQPYKPIVLKGGGYEHTEVRQGDNFEITTDTLTATYLPKPQK